MCDMAGGPREKTRKRALSARRFEPGMPGQRADAKRALLLSHIIERADPIDVDQRGGPCQAENQRWHEAWPAGQDLAFLTQFGEQIQRLVERARGKISE